MTTASRSQPTPPTAFDWVIAIVVSPFLAGVAAYLVALAGAGLVGIVAVFAAGGAAITALYALTAGRSPRRRTALIVSSGVVVPLLLGGVVVGLVLYALAHGGIGN